jgi:hypothetical protein
MELLHPCKDEPHAPEREPVQATDFGNRPAMMTTASGMQGYGVTVLGGPTS